jgi:MFS family permease
MSELSDPTNTARTQPGYKWAIVAMLWFVCFFNYADRQAIFSVFPLLESELHLSKIQLGVVGSAFMWVYAAMAPAAGIIGDRLKRKRLILGGLCFWSVVTIATGISTRLWHLITFRAIEGFGESFYFPASMSLISDYHGKQTRSRAMSFHQSSVYAGTIGGGAFAGLVAQYWGWRLGFYVFGAAGIALAIVLWRFIREPVRGESEPSQPDQSGPPPPVRAVVAELTRTPTAVVLMAVFFGANFVAMVFLTWMPSFLTESFHMNLALAGLTGTAFIQIASVIGVLIGGALADKWARHRAGGRMQAQVLGLICGAPFIFLTGWTLSVPFVIAGMTGFGLFKGIYDANIFASLYDVVPIRSRATAAGIMISAGWAGGALAPIAIGAASERIGLGPAIGYNGAIYVIAALTMVAGILAFVERDVNKLARSTP